MVSIHAPVGGATLMGRYNLFVGRVSIHAPVGGATHVDGYIGIFGVVSIHAPVGGATLLLRECFHRA